MCSWRNVNDSGVVIRRGPHGGALSARAAFLGICSANEVLQSVIGGGNDWM